MITTIPNSKIWTGRIPVFTKPIATWEVSAGNTSFSFKFSWPVELQELLDSVQTADEILIKDYHFRTLNDPAVLHIASVEDFLTRIHTFADNYDTLLNTPLSYIENAVGYVYPATKGKLTAVYNSLLSYIDYLETFEYLLQAHSYVQAFTPPFLASLSLLQAVIDVWQDDVTDAAILIPFLETAMPLASKFNDTLTVYNKLVDHFYQSEVYHNAYDKLMLWTFTVTSPNYAGDMKTGYVVPGSQYFKGDTDYTLSFYSNLDSIGRNDLHYAGIIIEAG
jgi:hypothetical protein